MNAPRSGPSPFTAVSVLLAATLLAGCTSEPPVEFCGEQRPANTRRLRCDTVPAGGIAPLSKLKNLRSVILKGASIDTLTPLAASPKIELLTIHNAAATDLSPLAGHQRLELLNLEGSAISDLAPIANLRRLRTLNLARTKVIDLRPLTTVPRLADLNLSGTQITDLTPLIHVKGLMRLTPPTTASAASLAALRAAAPHLQIVTTR